MMVSGRPGSAAGTRSAGEVCSRYQVVISMSEQMLTRAGLADQRDAGTAFQLVEQLKQAFPGDDVAAGHGEAGSDQVAATLQIGQLSSLDDRHECGDLEIEAQNGLDRHQMLATDRDVELKLV